MSAAPPLPPSPEAGDGLDRDRGLHKGVGAWGVGVAVFNTVVGAGIFVLPAELAREVGPAAPLAYLATTVAMAGVVLCFAVASSRAPTSGGPYGYAQAAFGPLAGFVVGVFVWLGSVLAAAGIGAAIADAAGAAWPALAQPGARAALIVALFAAFAAVNIAGVSPGTRLVGWVTVAKLVPIAVLLGVGALHARPANLAFSAPAPSAFGRAMILAAFAFQGMEGALAVSGEVRAPSRNIPRGLLGAMVAVAALYVAIQAVTQGVLGPALAGSKTPLADAMAQVSPALGALLAAGATVSMLGYLAGDTLSAPRLLFAFARDGLLPAGVAAIHPRTRAPWASIAIHTGAGCLLALTGAFAELVVLSALTTLVVYVVSCAAAVVMQRRGLALAGTPVTVKALPLAAVVGIVGMVWIGVQARTVELIGLGATLAGSAAWYAIARAVGRRRRS